MSSTSRDQQASSAEVAAKHPLRAITAMILATVAFTLGDAAMKLVAGSVPTGQAVFLRCAGSAMMVSLAAWHLGVITSARRVLVPLMAWRSAGDAGSALFFQAAVARMPFADIVGILQLTPLSLTAASAIFLGAHVGWRRWCAVAAGLIGALLVIKPGTSAFNVWAIFAVGTVLCGTLRDITTRRLDGTISPLVIMMLSQAVVALVALGLATFETWAWPTLAEALLIVFSAALTLAGHLWVIASIRGGDIATVAPFRYAGILWAILIGVLVWGELPDATSAAGIAILIAAGIYTFQRERRARLRETMPER
ncbi:MAG: DMT family transporter [Hyphomicrobiaceae bacterium]|nr:DMT family transporter [Hyphomicrobiaceae bacterium]